MSYISCVVASCSTQRKRNNPTKNEVVKCFSFPRDPVLREKWLALCQVDSLYTKDVNRKVCVRHFKEEDFVDGLKARLLNLQPTRLKKDAVPSLCLTYEDEEEERIKQMHIQKEEEIKRKLFGDLDNPPDTKKPKIKPINISVRNEYLSKLIPIAPKGVTALDLQKPIELTLEQNSIETKEKCVENREKIYNESVKKPDSYVNKLKNTLRVLMRDNTVYKKRIEELTQESMELKQHVKDLEAKIQNEEHGFMTKVKKQFSHIFTPNEVEVMLHKRTKSGWLEGECIKAYPLQCLSKKAYIYVKEILNYPLPDLSTLKAWMKELIIDEVKNNDPSLMLKRVRENIQQIEKFFSEFEDKSDLTDTIPLIGRISNTSIKEGTSENDIIFKKDIDSDLKDNEIALNNDNVKFIDEYENAGNEYIIPDECIKYEIQSSADSQCSDELIKCSYEFTKCNDELTKCSDESIKCSVKLIRSSDESSRCSDEYTKSSDEIYLNEDAHIKLEYDEYFEELIVDNLNENDTEIVDSKEHTIVEEEHG